ncbi:N-succinylarginine dihydrolase [soil metagenome]
MSSAHEINFDGLVGPTHNYAGLSYGNVASMKNKQSVSSPKQAAVQGLAKMKLLADLGLKQAVLPPHERPHVPTLKRLGFSGSDSQILESVAKRDPILLSAVSSASSMWAANAATVSPSADCADRKVHFTPANLISQFHRSIEPATTARILKSIFPESAGCFVHHPPLPAANHLSDEGAANHTRLCSDYGERGLEIFVYGRRAFDASDAGPRKFPARQTYEACAAIARNHQLDPDRVIFLRQNPDAIDAGAFHNDVVAVGNRTLMLFQEDAYGTAKPAAPDGMKFVSVALPLDDTVRSYLFNSQLVTPPNGAASLIAPSESEANPRVREAIEQLIAIGEIASVHYVDVRQSMQNGGGPACLRLRIVLTEAEISRGNAGVFWSEALHLKLTDWINRRYRDELRSEDLSDPKLLQESRDALDELTKILSLGTIYEFQGAA